MKDKFYVCPVCGNMFGVVHDGGVTPVCCGKPMKLIEANTTEAATEKHIPFVTVTPGACHIEVGDVPHPMSVEHHISWVCVVTNLGRHRIVLNPTEPAQVTLPLQDGETVLRVYAYCNLHGLWVKELEE